MVRLVIVRSGSVTQVILSGAATAIVKASENVARPAPLSNLILTLPARLNFMPVNVATPRESVLADELVMPVPLKEARVIPSTSTGVIAVDALTALPQASCTPTFTVVPKVTPAVVFCG